MTRSQSDLTPTLDTPSKNSDQARLSLAGLGSFFAGFVGRGSRGRSVRLVRGTAEAALVVWLAWVVAGLIWAPTRAPLEPSKSVTATPGKPGEALGPDTALLARFDPFARADSAGDRLNAGGGTVDNANPALVDAPETSLDLELYGVRVDRNEQVGTAIVQLPDKSQRAFTRQQELLDGVVLEGIYADRILISRNGVLESLFLDERAKQRARSRQQEGRSAPASSSASSPGPSPTAPTEAPNDAASISQADFTALLERVTLEPVRAANSNRIRGFRVPSGPQNTRLAQFGILPGDVLLQIAGRRLQGFEAFEELAQAFEPGRSAEVRLERAGQPLTVSITITN